MMRKHPGNLIHHPRTPHPRTEGGERPPTPRRPPRRRGALPLLAVLALAGGVFAAVSLWGALQPRPAPAVAPSGVVGTRPGDTAPDFRLRDIDGRIMTRTALVGGGKVPGLLFFTATWCLPCVEGLRQLDRFQRELDGRDRFRVLVVFVDPRETEDDLRAYRDGYRFPREWSYAPDTDQLLWKYRVRYLDTKFVLDPQGVIRWTDVSPAGYATWRRALAAVGIGR